MLFRLNDYTFEEISERLGAPFILKIPDGSFSGRHAQSRQPRSELRAALGEMFEHSAVLLAEEFIPTEFGLADRPAGRRTALRLQILRQPKGHWQIYNHARRHGPQPVRGVGKRAPIYKALRKCSTRRSGPRR
ncbi:MAG: hypothetical protein ACLSH3_15770 [Alistipes finegoldii]